MRFMVSEDEQVMLKQIGRQFPNFLDLIARLRTAELEAMALGSSEHFGTYRGRVQSLTELQQLLRS
jgi:Flp pilus assembly protein TadB